MFGYANVCLSDVACYAKQRISSNELNHSNYVSVENLLQNRVGKENIKKVPEDFNAIKFEVGDILIGNIRPYLKKIWFSDCCGGTNGDVLVVHNMDSQLISSRYLYYCLSSDRFFDYDMQFAKGAKMPRGDKNAVMNYQIYLPDIKTQAKVISILDRFDKLCNDISEGLPAEIEARQKQYEYYRDKLLSFKPLNKD